MTPISWVNPNNGEGTCFRTSELTRKLGKRGKSYSPFPHSPTLWNPKFCSGIISNGKSLLVFMHIGEEEITRDKQAHNRKYRIKIRKELEKTLEVF